MVTRYANGRTYIVTYEYVHHVTPTWTEAQVSAEADDIFKRQHEIGMRVRRHRRRFVNDRRTAITLAVLVGVAAVTAAVLFWNTQGVSVSEARLPVVESAARAPAVMARPESASWELASSESASAGAPSLPELARRCVGLLSQGPDAENVHLWPNADDASPDCVEALDARFSRASVMRTIVPLARPVTWGNVFDDVPGKLEAVVAAIEDESCRLGDGEFRPDLAERCAADEMVELAIFGEVCRKVHHRHGETIVTDGRRSPLLPPDDNPRYHYLSTVDARDRDDLLEALAAEAQDQETYWAARNRTDDLYFRTAWTRAKCRPDLWVLRAVRADRTERKPEGLRDDLEKTPLWNRAARLGHELAIANARYMSPEVVAHNPMQAYVRLARNTIESQRRSSPWGSHHAVAPGSSSQPISDDEFRDFLTDAGIPCRRPCTAKRLKEKKDDHSIMRPVSGVAGPRHEETRRSQADELRVRPRVAGQRPKHRARPSSRAQDRRSGQPAVSGIARSPRGEDRSRSARPQCGAAAVVAKASLAVDPGDREPKQVSSISPLIV